MIHNKNQTETVGFKGTLIHFNFVSFSPPFLSILTGGIFDPKNLSGAKYPNKYLNER